MLKIKTTLKAIQGKGIALIADENLVEGQVWWIWDTELDMIVKAERYALLDEISRVFVKKYGVKSDKGDYWLYTDNAKFCNHADSPNSIGFDCEAGVDTKIKTLRPIKKGEELTLDYRKFVFDFPDGILNFEVSII